MPDTACLLFCLTHSTELECAEVADHPGQDCVVVRIAIVEDEAVE